MSTSGGIPRKLFTASGAAWRVIIARKCDAAAPTGQRSSAACMSEDSAPRGREDVSSCPTTGGGCSTEGRRAVPIVWPGAVQGWHARTRILLGADLLEQLLVELLAPLVDAALGDGKPGALQASRGGGGRGSFGRWLLGGACPAELKNILELTLKEAHPHTTPCESARRCGASLS